MVDSNHFSVSAGEGICYVEFTDRKILDELAINEIQEQLMALVSEHKPVNLLLNFVNVQHLSSAALGMLITLRQEIESSSGQLRLSDINPQIFEVFKITQLHKVFDIHDTAAAAKASFAN
jgi:anti-sigma B factor antagonist